jgi:hypothetical protein
VLNAENDGTQFLKRCDCGELLGKPSLHDFVECECGEKWPGIEDPQLSLFNS